MNKIVLEWLNHDLRCVRQLTPGFGSNLGRLLPFFSVNGTFDQNYRT